MINVLKHKSAENRRMERFTLELPAQIAVAGQTQDKKAIELETTDICAGGAFFSTQQVVPIGTKVSIDLVLPLERFKEIRAKKALIAVTGKVIRTQETCMAVCFDKKYKISPLHP